MKTQIIDGGAVEVQFQAADVARLVERFFPYEEEKLIILKPIIEDFKSMSIGARQKVFEQIVKKHFMPKEAKMVMRLVSKFDEGRLFK